MRFSNHTLLLNTGDGVEIEPGEAHQMCNCSDMAIEFLTVSMPKSYGDKIFVLADI